jgi:hypothetical protein
LQYEDAPEMFVHPKVEDFAVTFKVQHETKFGESLCIVGGIEQLGFWKEFKCHMKWTPGHLWVSESPVLIQQNQSIF